MAKEKMSGEKRRAYILEQLKNNKEPITGKELAEQTGVSRQVIVTDIALLRTSKHPIVATSRGYTLQHYFTNTKMYEKVIVCKHTPEQTEEELNAIVDCGVTVVDVIVEHPLYGDITGSLLLSSRYDVARFIEKIKRNEGKLLSVLTGGVHLHTLRADSEEKINAACDVLDRAGILVTASRS